MLEDEGWHTVLIISETHVAETYKMALVNTPLDLVRWSLRKKFPKITEITTKLQPKRKKKKCKWERGKGSNAEERKGMGNK